MSKERQFWEDHDDLIARYTAAIMHAQHLGDIYIHGHAKRDFLSRNVNRIHRAYIRLLASMMNKYHVKLKK